MSNDAIGNGSNSDAMSQASLPEHATETEFLRRQSADTRRAIAELLREMRASLGQARDVKSWTRAYPWTSVGLAGALGFLAVRAFPRRRPAAGATAAREPLPGDAKVPNGSQTAETSPERDQPSLAATVAVTLIQSLAGVMESVLLAYLTAQASATPSPQAAAEKDEPEGNEPRR